MIEELNKRIEAYRQLYSEKEGGLEQINLEESPLKSDQEDIIEEKEEA